MNNRLRILNEDRDRILNMHKKYKNQLFLKEAYYDDTDDIVDKNKKYFMITNPDGKSYAMYKNYMLVKDSPNGEYRVTSGDTTDPNSETSKVKAMFDVHVDPYVMKLPTNFKGINYPWLGSDGSFNFKSLHKYEKTDPDFEKFMKSIESLSVEDKKELWKEMWSTSGGATIKTKAMSGEIPYPPLAWMNAWQKFKLKLFGEEGAKPTFDTPIFAGTTTNATSSTASSGEVL